MRSGLMRDIRQMMLTLSKPQILRPSTCFFVFTLFKTSLLHVQWCAKLVDEVGATLNRSGHILVKFLIIALLLLWT
jgi:hypothetical protein